MAEHTPAPWSVPHFARPEVNCECGYVLCDHLMGAVCTVHASGGGEIEMAGDNPRFEEAVANAHLIATAPDLLAACERAASLLDALARNTGSSGCRNVCNELTAAIAKAKGAP